MTTARPRVQTQRRLSAQFLERFRLRVATLENGYVVGTYMHGFFDDDRFRHMLLRALRAAAHLAPPAARASFTADRKARLDRLAAHVRRALDMRQIERWLR